MWVQMLPSASWRRRASDQRAVLWLSSLNMSDFLQDQGNAQGRDEGRGGPDTGRVGLVGNLFQGN